MPDFEVERFEFVSATPDTVLLRISGHWRSRGRNRLAPPLLVVDDGRRTHRLSPLPSPDDPSPLASPDGPPWRAAFSAPRALVERRGAAFALETGKLLVDLPAPRPAQALRSSAPAAPAPAPRAPAPPT